MTQFEIIKPSTRETFTVRHKELREALVEAGLDPAAVDHGMVMRGMGIVVYEFGLFEPAEKTAYFSLAGRLYAGNAVLYGIDAAGETVDIRMTAIPYWLPTPADVEKAIDARLCPRPVMSINGDKFWEWPQPAPESMRR